MEESEQKVVKHRKPLWRRILKWFGITALSILGLLLAALTVALWYLTPERLTPLVNRIASAELTADVRASRVELTFWSTFPRLEVRVDTLDIVSRRFAGADAEFRATLPAGADSLLSLERLTGGINPLKLMGGEVCLHDVKLTRPSVNLVVAGDMANFEIVPESDNDDEATALPQITIDRFVIEGDMPVRYRSLNDSIDATLTIASTSLKGVDAPEYALNLSGNVQGGLLAAMIDKQTIGLNGKVQWNQQRASRVCVEDLNLVAGAVGLHLTTAVDFAENLVVEYLYARLQNLDVQLFVDMVAPYLDGSLRDLSTDLTINAGVTTQQSFMPLKGVVPDFEVAVDAHSTHFSLDKIKLPEMWLDVVAKVDGANLDRSVIELKKLAMRGPAVDFMVNGNVYRPISNPQIKGEFHGNLAMQRLPRKLLDKLPFTIEGVLKGDVGMNFRLSDMNRTRFHKVKIDGALNLDGFCMAMRDSSMTAFANHADLHLGTSSSFKIKEYDVDSLLTMSLNVDTVSFYGQGMSLEGKTLKAGFGTKNISTSSDTSIINPIGGKISAERVRFFSAVDSVKLNFRETEIKGNLLRYKGDNRAPQVDLNIEARRIGFADGVNRASLSGGHVHLTLHPRSRGQASARLQAITDSIASVYPELDADSLRIMARAELRRNRRATDDGREKISYVESQTVKDLLRRWQASGDVKARRVRLMSPYFPVRNTVSGLDMDFSTDSVIIRDTKIRTGNTDFTVNGAVRNIYRALTSRRGAPLEMDLSVVSDTIDLNDIAAAAMRGIVYQSPGRNDDDFLALDSETEEQFMTDPDMAKNDTTPIPPILIPTNLNANLQVRGKNVHYNDLWLSDFRGMVSVYDGAVNMREFRANNGKGSFGVTALYTAPTRQDISFATGLTIRRFNLKEVKHIVPSVDSVLPVLNYMEGMVDVNGALTARIDSMMNLDLTSTNMVLKFSGDSLVLLDNDTFKKLSKWLFFKNKKRNMVDRMDVELAVHDGVVDVYPFVFDIDRYKLGVMGSNDAAFNLDYHVSVLKSPIPFKFGINIKGTPENMKIRLGGAKVNEKSVVKSRHIADTVRVNLINEIRTAFRKGFRSAGSKGLKLQRIERKRDFVEEAVTDTFTHQDSLVLIERGLIELPKPDSTAVAEPKDKKLKKK